ncbi:MAG: lactate utilization protein [Planctomycetes bacterium]|nr:lactate utilization protein [Planctomycetota bacterium]
MNREAFLQRVRQAVAEGNRAGAIADLPVRGGVGYQGAGPNPVQRFCDELRGAGGVPHIATGREAAVQAVLGLVRSKRSRNIMLGRGGAIERLDLAERLRAEGLLVKQMDDLSAQTARDSFFDADLGISNVAYLVAETGTVVMATQPDDPRSLSLLPPVHIAIAERRQILPDLFDLFDLFSPVSGTPPSCLTLITGPSKTGDIELKLVTGVHGPGEIHVLILDTSPT